jgi:methyl-accepting chemotaxis protein
MLAGFGTLCAILLIAVGFTLWTVDDVTEDVERIAHHRVPVALLSTSLTGDLSAVVANQRGYLLTGESRFKTARAAAWAGIDTTRDRIDTFAARFANPRNREDWTTVRGLLAEFRAVQDRVEAIAFTPAAFPATKLLNDEAAPRARAVGEALDRMKALELEQPVSAERRQLLADLAEARAELAMASANLRAFLLTGDANTKRLHQERFADGEKSLAAVGAAVALLTDQQRQAWQTVTRLVQEYRPINDRVIQIRESDGWNVPVQMVLTEAAPLVDRMQDLLAGPVGANGVRSGGMADRQRERLTDDTSIALSQMIQLRTIEWVLLAVGVALGVIIVIVLHRTMITPIVAMTAAMRRLADGDTTVDVPAVGRRDEIGSMADAVQVFKQNRIEGDRMAEAQRVEQAEKQRRVEQVDKLTAAFERKVGDLVGQVSAAATELQATAGSMTNTAQGATLQATNVAAAAEQASVNVQTVATAAEELAASIGEISRQVGQSAQVAGRAVEDARRTDGVVRALADSAQKIGEVVSLISSIAGQTNLLALNATIEAARAGDAGKGFAVVASEVKSLASQTARATEDISQQVTQIQTATRQAVEAIDGISSTITEVSRISAAIASAVEEQGAATQEIARNVQQASAGTREVTSNIAGVSESATATGAAATQVLGAAGELSRQAEQLNDEIGQFIVNVKAA